MIIKRSREHTVNLSNYENVRISAGVEFEAPDGAELAGVAAQADEALDALLKRDLAEALANVPEGKDTHLASWNPA